MRSHRIPVWVCLIAWCCGSAVVSAAEHTTDSLDVVKERLKSGTAVLLDVREPSEWKDGHLQAAQLLSLSRVRKGVPAEELQRLMPEGRIVYAHCAAGVRCLEVADRLKGAGFEIRALKPGYRDLLKAGFPKADQ